MEKKSKVIRCYPDGKIEILGDPESKILQNESLPLVSTSSEEDLWGGLKNSIETGPDGAEYYEPEDEEGR